MLKITFTVKTTIVLNKKAYESILDKTKTYECRISYPNKKITNVLKGDIISLRCGQAAPVSAHVKVLRVEYFNTFEEMLRACDYKQCVPYVNSFDDAVKLYHSLGRVDENGISTYTVDVQKYGAVAIQIELLDENCEYVEVKQQKKSKVKTVQKKIVNKNMKENKECN